MQVLEDLPVRPQHRSLVIGDRVLLTEALCFSQAVARHAWEEMVLNLVVESSIPEVCHGMRFHIGVITFFPDKIPAQQMIFGAINVK